jgi:hypothetical protein
MLSVLLLVLSFTETCDALVILVEPSVSVDHFLAEIALINELLVDLRLFYLQAMRFPPKSYNKDLESAEVAYHTI